MYNLISFGLYRAEKSATTFGDLPDCSVAQLMFVTMHSKYQGLRPAMRDSWVINRNINYGGVVDS